MEVLDNNSFRQCGICPGNLEALKATYQISDNDPYKNNAPLQEDFYEGCDLAEKHVEGDYSWYKVYTDGSGYYGTQRKIARAGWGVFYGKGSESNISSKLHGPVQTSYRAELRALLHVVRNTTVHVMIMIDC